MSSAACFFNQGNLALRLKGSVRWASKIISANDSEAEAASSPASASLAVLPLGGTDIGIALGLIRHLDNLTNSLPNAAGEDDAADSKVRGGHYGYADQRA
ncbi:hypothetical protein ACFCXF_31030 [Streptomyces virginiae]|uniref:hypothetical protein n=1 Tax=Streptomyces virginiae TaxID=1961 RepID=UPI0035E093E3